MAALTFPALSFPALLLAVSAHELGHILTALCLGARELRLRPGPLGFVITYRPTSLSLWGQAVSALAGPVSGYLLYLAAKPAQSGWLSYTAELSRVLSCINLLPLPPLDGGVFLKSVLEELLGPARADTMARWAEGLTLLLLFLLTLFSCLAAGRPLWMTGPLLLFVLCCEAGKNEV